MQKKNSARLASLALVATSTVGAIAFIGPAAHAICDVDTTFVKKTTKGTKVWIPSNGFPAGKGWQQGGTISINTSSSTSKAKSKGSADTVGGGGGLNIGIGSVSAKYDHTWNRSTTKTSTYGTSETRTLGQKGRWRPRLYAPGYRFTATTVTTYFGGCPSTVTKAKVLLPSKRGAWLLGKESYKTRGEYKAR